MCEFRLTNVDGMPCLSKARRPASPSASTLARASGEGADEDEEDEDEDELVFASALADLSLSAQDLARDSGATRVAIAESTSLAASRASAGEKVADGAPALAECLAMSPTAS
jgi:hypothetical protein